MIRSALTPGRFRIRSSARNGYFPRFAGDYVNATGVDAVAAMVVGLIGMALGGWLWTAHAAQSDRH
jgi:hypothetical protein